MACPEDAIPGDLRHRRSCPRDPPMLGAAGPRIAATSGTPPWCHGTAAATASERIAKVDAPAARREEIRVGIGGSGGPWYNDFRRGPNSSDGWAPQYVHHPGGHAIQSAASQGLCPGIWARRCGQGAECRVKFGQRGDEPCTRSSRGMLSAGPTLTCSRPVLGLFAGVSK